LINSKNGADTDVIVDGKSAVLSFGTYLLREAKKNDISFKLGKGFFNTKSGNISFEKAKRRYFLVNRYKLTGSATSNEKSIGIGVPNLMEIGHLAGEIIMESLARLGIDE
jgi:hypothetical protein